MRKKIIFWVFVFIMAVSLAYAVIYNVRLDEIARRTFDGRYTVVYALMVLPCLHFTVYALSYILACEFLWLDIYVLIRDEYDIFVLAGAFMAIGVFSERE